MAIPASKLSLVILVIITATTRPPITDATTTVPPIGITPTPVTDSVTTQSPKTDVSTAPVVDAVTTVIQISVTAAAITPVTDSATTQFLATDTVTTPHLATDAVPTPSPTTLPSPTTPPSPITLPSPTTPPSPITLPSPTTPPAATVVITTQPPITTTQPPITTTQPSTNKSASTQLASSTITTRTTGISSGSTKTQLASSSITTRTTGIGSGSAKTQLASSSIITRTTGISRVSSTEFTTDSSGFGGVSQSLYLGLGFCVLLIAILIGVCIFFCIICYAKSDHGKKKDPEKSVHWSANDGTDILDTADKQDNFASTLELLDTTEVEKRKMTDVTVATFGFSEGTTETPTLANNPDGQEQEVKDIEFREQDGIVLSDLPESAVVVS